ncbi:MAG: leucine-rich repeat domain-containing protein [Clostridia bacterium]|nr:leucine-rich repeat domain-containing protein [Clostridia bacterium]
MTKTIKKTLALVLSLVMLISVMPMGYSFAATYGEFEYSTSGSSATITKYNGNGLSVEIPEKILTYTIVAVGDGNNMPFYGKDITSVEIPDTVKTIGSGAFYGCKSLTEVILGDGVETIDRTAFGSCSVLSSIVIGKNVKAINGNAFKGCDILDTEGSVVNYKGTKSQWEAITIGSGNEKLTGANIVFNYGRDCAADGHIIGEMVESEAADCLNDGNVEYYPCEVEGCGAKFADATGSTALEDVVIPGGHKLTQTEAKAPSCAEEGNPEYWYCSECDKYFTTEQAEAEVDSIVLEKTDAHSYKWVPKVAETCVDSGKKGHHYCAVCDSYFNHSYEKVTEESLFLAAKGHELVKVEEVVNCLEEGHIEYWDCINCDAIFADENGETELNAEDIVTGAAGHIDKILIKEVKPTCTTGGNTPHIICERCETTLRAYITRRPLGHDFVLNTEKSIAATCEKGGENIYECSRCTEIKREKVQKLGHTEIVFAEEIIPTCTKGGQTEGVSCTVCKKVLKDSVTREPLGHDFVLNTEKSIAATCEKDGENIYDCSRCTETKSEKVDKTGHNLVATTYTVVTDSTCKAEGTSKTYCSNCETYIPGVIEMKPHTEAEPLYEAPTCTVDGYRGRIICSDCGDILVPGEVLPAEHDYALVAETAPACEKAGSKTYACQVEGCNATYTDTVAPLEHTRPEEWNEILAPTCTERGAKIKTCITCGDVLTEVIPLLDHEFITYVSDGDATCTEDGFKTATCNRENCEATDTIADVGSALGHDFGETVPAATATCLAEGNHAYKYCEVCAKYYNGDAEENELAGVSSADYFIIEQLEHKYEGAIKSDGNSEDATHSFKCVNGCNRYGDAESHIWNDGEETTAPECAEDGEMTYTCTVEGCGATYTEVIDALGHEFGAVTTAAAPTCLADGNYAYKYCAVCEMYFAETDGIYAQNGEESAGAFAIEQLEHKYEGAIRSDGNGENATHSFKCVNGCNEYGAAVTHTWNSGVVTVAPECTETGVKTYTCTVENCGAVYTETIDALGHEFGEITDAVEATCLEDGNEAYKFCAVCEMYFAGNAAEDSTAAEESADEFIIDQLEHVFSGVAVSNGDGEDETHSFMCINGCEGYGATEEHLWDDGVIAPAATCTDDGLKTYTCTVEGCGAIYTEVLYAPGHSFGEITEAVDATCLEDGNEAYKKCSACNKYFAGNADDYSTDAENSAAAFVIDMLGHSFTEYESNEDATCLEDGTKTAVCDRCDAEDTVDDEDSALGHDYVIDEEVSKEVTCTENGREKAECSRCGDAYDNEYEALGHDVTNWVVSEIATCTKEGLNIGRCNNCLKVIRESTSKVDHKDENNDKLCDSCGTSTGTPDDTTKPDDTTPSEPTNPDGTDEEKVECSCYCHKKGILRFFFFDIPLLFQRLLGRNKVCKCGLVNHY